MLITSDLVEDAEHVKSYIYSEIAPVVYVSTAVQLWLFLEAIWVVITDRLHVVFLVKFELTDQSLPTQFRRSLCFELQVNCHFRLVIVTLAKLDEWQHADVEG